MNAQVRLFQKLDKSLDSIDYNDNSVYTGTTGIALFYWKLFSLTGNRAYIEKSHQLVRSALERRKGKRVTFASGDAGPLALGAVIYEQMGRREKAQKYVDELYGKSSWVRKLDIDLPDEFLYGRVGYLFSLLFVAKHVGAWTVQHEVIHSTLKDASVPPERSCKTENVLVFHNVEFALTNRDTPATTENSGDTTTMPAPSPLVCQTLPSFSLRSS